jgi:hypothetical protein
MAGWGLIRAKHKSATNAIKNLLGAPGRPATAAPANVMPANQRPLRAKPAATPAQK